MNHPNRGPRGPQSNPDPADIRTTRRTAGITQTAAASIVHSGVRRWQEWEAGTARMHPGLWELFKIKIERLAKTGAADPENDGDENGNQ